MLQNWKDFLYKFNILKNTELIGLSVILVASHHFWLWDVFNNLSIKKVRSAAVFDNNQILVAKLFGSKTILVRCKHLLINNDVNILNLSKRLHLPPCHINGCLIVLPPKYSMRIKLQLIMLNLPNYQTGFSQKKTFSFA